MTRFVEILLGLDSTFLFSKRKKAIGNEYSFDSPNLNDWLPRCNHLFQRPKYRRCKTLAGAQRPFACGVQMTRVLLGMCVLFSVASIANAAGDWWGHLEGDIGVGQMPLVDLAPTDPPAAYFVIKGDAAKRMYEKMGGEVVARQDSCEEGVVTKFSGDLQCAVHVNDQIYVCDIGVDLLKGKSIVGRGC